MDFRCRACGRLLSAEPARLGEVRSCPMCAAEVVLAVDNLARFAVPEDLRIVVCKSDSEP